MREDNDGMDFITRTEFDAVTKHLVTKEALHAALADTKEEIVDVIKSEMGRLWLQNKVYVGEEITRAKLEILSVNKKNIADAIAPLNSRLDRMDVRLDRMDGRFDQMDGRLDRMDGRLDQMDGRFDRMDGELRKLGEGQAAIANDVATIAKFAQAVLDEHENRLKDAKL